MEVPSGRAELAAAMPTHQFFFPRMKKELPSGMGTIFSFGPEKSGLSGATPAKRCTQQRQVGWTGGRLGHVTVPGSPSSPSMALSSSFSCQSSSSFCR